MLIVSSAEKRERRMVWARTFQVFGHEHLYEEAGEDEEQNSLDETLTEEQHYRQTHGMHVTTVLHPAAHKNTHTHHYNHV